MMLKLKVKTTSVTGRLFLFSLYFSSSSFALNPLPYFCVVTPFHIKSPTASALLTTVQRLLTNPSLLFMNLLSDHISQVSGKSNNENEENKNVCRQLNTCACRLTNGSGIISLEGVAFYNGHPRFIISESERISVAYNPCVAFTLKPDKSFLGLKKEFENKENPENHLTRSEANYCTNAAVCKFPTSGNSLHYQNLGQPDSAKFDFDQKENKLFIRYTSPDHSLTTTVYLTCNNINQLSIKEEHNNSLILNLQTVCACPNSCYSVMNTFSLGTYIVIVFTSVIFSYLILGILYKKVVHSAEGKELIPNRQSWTSFFSLVKDGYLFFISPCIGNTVEYRYYQKL